jgi:hypothetical protein
VTNDWNFWQIFGKSLFWRRLSEGKSENRRAGPGLDHLLCARLFALCDRGIDLGDCIALAPIVNELENVLPWLEQQDANPDWPGHVRATVADLRRRLSHGI